MSVSVSVSVIECFVCVCVCMRARYRSEFAHVCWCVCKEKNTQIDRECCRENGRSMQTLAQYVYVFVNVIV